MSTSSARIKIESEAKMPELKTENSKLSHQIGNKVKNTEFWSYNEDFVDWVHVKTLVSYSSGSNKCSLDPEASWMRNGKTEPWWRSIDGDELSSLVKQKSSKHLDNCDLPPPQSIRIVRGVFPAFESFDDNDLYSSAFEQSKSTMSNIDSEHMNRESQHQSDHETSKVQLLEALLHSQSRAREADKAAKEAITEKEHIIKLFFRQASHLFAYKQWLQILQLETICLQLKKEDTHFSTLLPGLPWIPFKNHHARKIMHSEATKKKTQLKHDFSRYAMAFTIGLGLAGVGLLLGQTLGWLFSTI